MKFLSLKAYAVAGLIAATVGLAAAAAQATPITFQYTEPTHSAFGSFTFDDSLLSGTSSQALAHSTITAFSFTVPGASWGIGNLIADSAFNFDSTGPIPDVVGAGGQRRLMPAAKAWSFPAQGPFSGAGFPPTRVTGVWLPSPNPVRWRCSPPGSALPGWES